MRRTILGSIAPLALVAFPALLALLACKGSKETRKDDDLASGRKPIAAAGGTKGASKSLDDDDDLAPKTPKSPKGPLLESKTGQFEVNFPVGTSVPEEKLDPVSTAIGTVIMHNFMNESPLETSGACFVDYPPGHVLRSGGASTVLVNVENGAVSSMFAIVDHHAEITVDGRLARDFTFSIAGPPAQYGHQRVTFVGDRLYQLIYVSAKGKTDVESPRVRAFFDSFHVTE